MAVSNDTEGKGGFKVSNITFIHIQVFVVAYFPHKFRMPKKEKKEKVKMRETKFDIE